MQNERTWDLAFCHRRSEARHRFARSGDAARLLHKAIRMNIIGSIIIGLIVGVIAKLLHPGKDPGGFIISILLGLGGSLVAGWLGRTLGWYNEGEPAGFIFSVVGAVLILAGYRMLSKKKS